MPRPVASALALALALAGCGSPGGGPVRIALFRGEELTPLAESLGHFAAEGAPVELHELPSSSKAMEALFGGSVDVVAGGFDQAIRLAAQGRVARAFEVMMVRSPMALVASPRARKPVRSVVDLSGATVGVSAFGSSGHNMVNLLLTRAGIAPAAVNVIATGGGHAVTVAAAEQGKVDAIVTLPASLAILRARKPDLVVLADGQTADGTRAIYGVDRYPAVCLMARPEWLSTNRDLAGKLARAMIRTQRWVASHTAEEFQRAARKGGGAPEELPGFAATIASVSPDGLMPPGGPEAARDAVAASLPEARAVDLAALHTAEAVR